MLEDQLCCCLTVGLLSPGRLAGMLFGDNHEPEQEAQTSDSASDSRQPAQHAQAAQYAQQAFEPENLSGTTQDGGAAAATAAAASDTELDADSEKATDNVDWAEEQEVEREALAAGQQLARDNSQALREVRQAMLPEAERHNVAPEEAEGQMQDETSWGRTQEVEREALAAGQQLARDNNQALQEVRQAMQGKSSFDIRYLTCPM